MQLAAAYGALANGGVLMRPYLVAKVVDPDGVVLLENKPTAGAPGRLARRPPARCVAMLESVVEKEGTAPKARMDEYRVAGKTGTAQKVDPVARGYSDKRIASFIGMVPAEDPRLVICVVIDEPKTDVYGGLVAAPAFKEIADGGDALPGRAPPRAVVPESPCEAVGAEEGLPIRRPMQANGGGGCRGPSRSPSGWSRGVVSVPDCARAGRPGRSGAACWRVPWSRSLRAVGGWCRRRPAPGSARVARGRG